MAGVPASNFQGTSFQVVPVSVTLMIMLPPVMKGGIASSSSAAPPQRADSRRAQHLVPGEGQEVGAQLDDVDRHVRHALRRVDQDQRAGVVRQAGDLGDRVDGAEGVADVADGDQLRSPRQSGAQVVEIEPAVIGDADVLEARPGLGRQLLPGDQVGVVLHLGRQDQVAGADVRAAPAVGDQVDRLGRVAHEDDLALAREPR